MNDSDVAELVGWFLSAFGVGFMLGYLLRVFRRAADFVSR